MVQGRPLSRRAYALSLLLLAGCGDGGGSPSPSGSAGGAAPGDAPSPGGAVYASSVEAFSPGEGAGYHAEDLPDIVLGPPRGGGRLKGSLDVLSLGSGGEIVLGFGERGVVDGAGPDLIVFENAFWPEGDPTQVFAELGEVAISEDGESWRAFECDARGDGEGNFPGCAGVTPTLEYDAEALAALTPSEVGGDAFDLADLGVERARYVRIRDLRTLAPAGTSSGFDLDAVGVVNAD